MGVSVFLSGTLLLNTTTQRELNEKVKTIGTSKVYQGAIDPFALDNPLDLR